jgi:hypothetical protein
LFGGKMPTYAEFGGWVISTIAGWFGVTADSDLSGSTLFLAMATALILPKAGY